MGRCVVGRGGGGVLVNWDAGGGDFALAVACGGRLIARAGCVDSFVLVAWWVHLRATTHVYLRSYPYGRVPAASAVCVECR